MNKLIDWNEDKWAKFVIAVDKSIDIMDSHHKTEDEVLDFKEIWSYTQKRIVKMHFETVNFWAVKTHIINRMQKGTLADIRRADRELDIYSFSAMTGWWR
tara:strand:+ start:79 stop:378 length:300 start_codon:yes stop_codon:yes gene_type:complete